MEVYLVGGAVRDELLGRPVTERDWVVVGASAEDMLHAGYRQVGRDFPVFLHPETGEEYALARTERKSGPGHTGFIVHADPYVSLDEDLQRRDLTVNAMARSEAGALIDPWSGQQDLNARTLRHVSMAFSEDPLRVFRVARFAAQLEDFTVAPETAELMRQMSAAGALAELSAERVWAELHKALCSDCPGVFFQVLRDTDSLRPWFAELATSSLEIPAGLTDPIERYASLIGPLGGEKSSALGARIKCPRDADRLAGLVAAHLPTLSHWRHADTDQLYAALQASRAFKKDAQLPRLLRVIAALTGKDLAPLLGAVEAIDAAVQVSQLQRQGLSGAALGDGLDAGRIVRLREVQQRGVDAE